MSSSSDRTQFKSMSVQLKNRKLVAPVIGSSEYAQFVQYAAGNNIINTKPQLNSLLATGHTSIFGSDRSPALCPSYVDCPRSGLVTRVPTNDANSNFAAIRPYRPIVIKNPSQKNNCGHPCQPLFT